MSPRAHQGSTDRERPGVRISRDYDYPRESVFAMCTDPEKAARWFLSPEEGVTVLFEVDARPGGAVRIHGHHGDGQVFRTSGTFLDIVVPERIVLKTATTPPGGAAPFEALQTLTFEELGPKRSRVTVHVKVLGAGSFPGGIDSLEEGFQGGWQGTLALLQRELRSVLHRPPAEGS